MKYTHRSWKHTTFSNSSHLLNKGQYGDLFEAFPKFRIVRKRDPKSKIMTEREEGRKKEGGTWKKL